MTAEPIEAARLDALVRGRVQGVGFRMFVRDVAEGLGLTGRVSNEASGRVRCVAEGPRERLDLLVVALRDGPPGARVDHVDVAWQPATHEFGRFEIRSGWHGGD